MNQEKKEFARSLVSIALPISMQSLIQSVLGMIDQIMIGQLGSVSVAAVSLGGRPCFIMLYGLGGIAAAASIFASQYEGAKEFDRHAHVMRAALALSLAITVPFLMLSALFPGLLLSVFTRDTEVISIGKSYLQINSAGYLPLMVTVSCSALLRATGHTKVPLVTGFISVAVNTVLNALLIFGLCGFPALGTDGAAMATVIARLSECVILAVFMQKKNHPASIRSAVSCRNEIPFSKLFYLAALPAVANELVWALGDAGYTALYGQMGTEQLAAMTLTFPVQGLSVGFFSGLSAATGILLGNTLGAGKFSEAYRLSYKFISISIALCLVMAAVLWALAPVYIGLYKVEERTGTYGRQLLRIFACYLWIKVCNMVIGSGILRSGGKTKYTLFMDVLGTWGIGIPLGLLGAAVLRLEVTYVYALLSLEEAVRLVLGLYRVKSKKWMHNLAKTG